jgi:thiamine pyrophosphokinase
MNLSHKRVVIFSGGLLQPTLLNMLDHNDFIIGADRGALFLIEHGVTPHLSVGDFDSVDEEEFAKIKIHSNNVISCDAVNKDLTDTELALEIAIEHQPSEIVMLGVTGTRLDHTLSNIHLLMLGMQAGIPTSICDNNNYITLSDSSSNVQQRGYTYVSLLPLTPEVTGITLSGFQYPLKDATLRIGQSLGVSNRLTSSEGTVHIKSGLLLIIQSMD